MDFNPQKENKERQMKVQAINTNNYQQNKPSFKAYIKPNANFYTLYRREIMTNSPIAHIVKQFNELPNHSLEIVALKTHYALNPRIESLHGDKIECKILNNTTKQTENYTIQRAWRPLNELMEAMIALKDKPFFNTVLEKPKASIKTSTTGEARPQIDSLLQQILYKTMTTGEPLPPYLDLTK